MLSALALLAAAVLGVVPGRLSAPDLLSMPYQLSMPGRLSAPERSARGAADLSVPMAHAGAVLLGMRVFAGLAWPEKFDVTRFSDMGRQLHASYTEAPDRKGTRDLLRPGVDSWWVNGPGHATFGTAIYGRTRQCGGSPAAAFAIALGAAVVWEYGFEAPHTQPSAVDLFWTPLAGMIFGETQYRLHRWLRSRDAPAWLLVAVDPLGEGERRLVHTRC